VPTTVIPKEKQMSKDPQSPARARVLLGRCACIAALATGVGFAPPALGQILQEDPEPFLVEGETKKGTKTDTKIVSPKGSLVNLARKLPIQIRIVGDAEGRKGRLVDGTKGDQFVRAASGDPAANGSFSYRIDLQENFAIKHIVLTPRNDAAHAKFLSNFRIRVRCDEVVNTKPLPLYEICSEGQVSWTSGKQFADGSNAGIEAISYPVKATGRYVRVATLGPGPHVLQLAEIEVFGYPY
jgi:hypothetical protein